jgi:hypothetical protein
MGESLREPETDRVPLQPAARALADQLGETNPAALAQIQRLVRLRGVPFAQQVLADALALEQQGGLWLPDRSQRRTLGGVFFVLVKDRLTMTQRRRVFAPPPDTWLSRLDQVREATKEKGTATTVKITLVGRPGRVVQRQHYVLTSLESRTPPPLPKGLPVPTAPRTTYTVYIPLRQWRKVEASLADPNDVLVVEGFPVADAQTHSVAVFAQNTTTKLLQRTQKLAQAAQANAALAAPATPPHDPPTT